MTAAPVPATTARAALVRQSDLGRGWSVESAAARAPTLTCRGFAPPLTGVRQLASVASPTFQATKQGPFLSEAVHLYKTSRQARVVWRHVITRGLLRCVAAELTVGSGSNAQYAVTRSFVAPLAGSRVRDRLTRYRVDGTATGNGQTLAVHLDALVILHGRALGVLDITSLGDPPSNGAESALARAAARELDRTH